MHANYPRTVGKLTTSYTLYISSTTICSTLVFFLSKPLAGPPVIRARRRLPPVQQNSLNLSSFAQTCLGFPLVARTANWFLKTFLNWMELGKEVLEFACRFCLRVAAWALLRPWATALLCTTAHSCMPELPAVEPSVQKPKPLSPPLLLSQTLHPSPFIPTFRT